MLRAFLVPLVFAQAVSTAPARDAPVPSRTLTLQQALDTAAQRQPLVRQARAATNVSRARMEQARAGYLPQLNGTATYLRRTGNFAPQPGNPAGGTTSSKTYDQFNFALNATQLIYDFGQTNGRWHAADVVIEASEVNERSVFNQTQLTVKRAYYSARAQKSLVKVAEETLVNQDRHLRQIQGFVQVGTRPEIDLVQARTDFANSRVLLINSQNNYEVAKAAVNQAMGIVSNTDFDVADEDSGPLADEELPIDALVKKAVAQRPELVNLAKQRAAQEISIRAAKGAYGPSLAATANANAGGTDLGGLVPNWSVGAALNWPIFSGWQTHGVVHEAEANLGNIDAQYSSQQLQIGFDVQQAWLAVKANKESIGAAREALANARERLRLAEGRYQTGVGSVIELGDAQVAATNAAAQVVQADYNLATARAQLLAAMGRSS